MSSSTIKYTVADLYGFVKAYDKDFTPAPPASTELLNEDGTPRGLYHWINSDFTVFDTGRSGSNQGKTHGDGIYLSASPNEFSYAGSKRMELYATVLIQTERQRKEINMLIHPATSGEAHIIDNVNKNA